MYIDFSEVIYFERNLVETVISVIKRLFGEEVKARKYRNQVKEVKTKLILYNIHRSIVNYDVLIIIKVFYRAELFRQSCNLLSMYGMSSGCTSWSNLLYVKTLLLCP